jgi:hypothetical protein
MLLDDESITPDGEDLRVQSSVQCSFACKIN